jgi:hypothetical protein
MQKVIQYFFLFLGALWALNAIYVFIFTSSSDEFRVLGLFETNKIIAGLTYLGLSMLVFGTIWMEKRKKDKKV